MGDGDYKGLTCIDVHWRKISGFHIEIDISLVIDEMDFDMEYFDKEELEEDFDVVNGILYVRDFDSGERVETCAKGVGKLRK